MMLAKKGTLTALPKLRFPEFREAPEWTLGKASDIVDVLQGYGFPEKFQGGKEGEFPFYKVSDISACVDAGGVFLTDANNHIDSNTMVELRARPMPVAATVFAKIGEAIRSNKRAITTRPCLVDNNAAGVKAITGLAQDRFVYYLWCQVPLIEYAGGVVPAVNKSAIEQIPVSYPQPDEQQKIADCLTSLDDVIAAQGRKVEALKAHKRGLMQQLFPREGETRPRLRFSEFRNASEWESKTLGGISSISSGVTPLRSNPEFHEGGTIPWVKTTDLNNSLICATQECVTSKAKVTINPVGSVVVAMYGGFNQIGRTGLLRIPAATNQALSVLRVRKEVVLPIYLLTWLNAKVEDWKRIASSSRKDPNITSADVARFPICVPALAEQQRIADFLSSLDTQITAESNQLAALKTHKQGLMQHLFPAPETVNA